MNVPAGMELSEKDFELLSGALDDYEKAPHLHAVVDSIVKTALSRAAMDDVSLRRTMDVATAQADRDTRSRKSVCVILRAKLELARQALQSAAIAMPETGGAA